MASKFGGIPVEEQPASASKFGGVPVGDSEPVDLRPRNVGEDHSGEGFWAHAGKTIRDLPDAFLSGRMISGPIQAVGRSMEDYIGNPTVHNMVRAIPGVGMAEDALTQPYRTAKSGDTMGAIGDAVDLSGQLALGLRGRTPEPLQESGIAIPKTSRTVLPNIPQSTIDASHALPIPGMGLVRAGMRVSNGIGKLLNRESPVAEGPNPFPPEGRRVYDMRFSPDLNRDIAPQPITQFGGSIGRGLQPGFRDATRSVHSDPVNMNEVSGTTPPFAGPFTREVPEPVSLKRSDVLPVWSGIRNTPSRGLPDVDPVRASLPSGRQAGSAQSAAGMHEPETLPGATAASPGVSARFTPGQYDAPAARPLQFRNSARPEGISPPAAAGNGIAASPEMADLLQRSIERVNAAKADRMAAEGAGSNGTSPRVDKVRRRK